MENTRLKAERPPGVAGGQRLEKNCDFPLSTESIPQIGRDGQVILFDGVRYVRVGHIRGDIFVKCLRPQHLLKHPAAVALQSDLIPFLRAHGVQTIRAELPNGIVAEASLESFIKHGFKFNRGHGAQVGLLLHRWRVVNPRQGVLPLVEEVS